jgi:hypothetical protein
MVSLMKDWRRHEGAGLDTDSSMVNIFADFSGKSKD